jgi:hypothetical protein
MAVTIIRDLAHAAATQPVPVSIGSLANGEGMWYRHPDSACISYPRTVQQPLGSVPNGGISKIAIVGAGAAGIAALYELGHIARNCPGHQLEVTIFETDASNFLFRKQPPDPDAATVRRAGRVSSYCTPHAVYEIGAMRFPSIAGLTWHYAAAVFGAKQEVKAFPNPGTVPTEFVFGSQFDRYKGDTWQDPNSPTKAVRDLVLDGLTKGSYRIGSQTPTQLMRELKDKTTSLGVLRQIQRDWKSFVEQHEGTTLEAAVREVLKNSTLPQVAGLRGGQLLNWCVELFGRFGFGTGGFKPLYSVSLVEFMRLLLWDYSNEYVLPSTDNVEFIERLNQAAQAENLNVMRKQARVTDVFHQSDTRQAVICSYADSESPADLETFDYAILAVPHDAATAMVSRLGYLSQPLAQPLVGDFDRASPTPPGGVLPPLLLSETLNDDAVNARIVTAISTLHMTRSAKVFALIKDNNAVSPPVPLWQENEKVHAVISDSGLAATYMVPSTVDPDYRSFLVSYTWEDDTTKLQHALAEWPGNAPPPGPSAMFEAMLNRVYRQNPETPRDPALKWWLSAVLNKSESQNRVSWDWSTYITCGGFKLDMSGDYYQSNLCFRYHTHAALRDAPDNRVFLASDSYSHLGGWLEGAFMSAINAVAGIVLSINGKDLTKLNLDARQLFTELTPILPMN